MPIQTGNWGNTTPFPNITLEIGHLDESSTHAGDEVVYPPVPDTSPSPYFSWHFTKHASSPRNYYGYKNRFQQVSVGTYTAPYPNLYPDSANPTAWEFNIYDPNKILQRAVKTNPPCFYNETNFEFETTINFTRSFASVGSSCSGNEHFFLDTLPIGTDFLPTGQTNPFCTPLPEVCESRNNGGHNNNTGGNGGATTGDICDFSGATTGARHSFCLALGNSYEAAELICAIVHTVYTQTDGVNRKYGHYIEVKIISDTQPTYTITVNNSSIQRIKFTIKKEGTGTRVRIFKIYQDFSEHDDSPYVYQISYPIRVFLFNLLATLNNGYNIVSSHLTNYRVTSVTTQPKITWFGIQSSIFQNATRLEFESTNSHPPQTTDHFTSVQFSRQATPHVYENATKSGARWVISNISPSNSVHSVRFNSDPPIESIFWSAEYPDDPPPPPPEEAHHFALTINEGGFGIGKQIQTEIGVITACSDPIAPDSQTMLRIGNLPSLMFPNDIRIANPKRFRYLFLEYPVGKGLSGSFGPGFKIEIDELEIKNQPYKTGGIDFPIAASIHKGTPVFVDIQPVENPHMFFPHYNWIRQTIMFHRWDGTINSLVELSENQPVTIKLAYFVIYKQH